MNRTEQTIRKQMEQHPALLYMKGTPDFPMCGFSARAVAALKSTGFEFAYVNVLEAPFIRERLPEVTGFPTFPQLIIKGEIVGGSDIIEELLGSGELTGMLESAAGTAA